MIREHADHMAERLARRGISHEVVMTSRGNYAIILYGPDGERWAGYSIIAQMHAFIRGFDAARGQKGAEIDREQNERVRAERAAQRAKEWKPEPYQPRFKTTNAAEIFTCDECHGQRYSFITYVPDAAGVERKLCRDCMLKMGREPEAR